MVIALKFYAIYLLSQVIIGIPTLVALGLHFKNWTGTEPNKLWTVFVPVMSVLFGVGAAFLIWKCSDSLFKKESLMVSDPGVLGADGVMKIVLSCMGVYFIINGVVMIPHSLVNFQIVRRLPESQVLLPAVDLLSKVLEIVFGSLLVVTPYKWIKVLRKGPRR